MILSFHPCFEADANILCAGRVPDERDLAAIRIASAVILPQGCREDLHRMARENCANVFPDYDARFEYPGKTGQARLFQALGAPCPRTWVFDDMAHFRRQKGSVSAMSFPLVFKLDWGGEGDTVFLLQSNEDLERTLEKAERFENCGQRGFVLQALVPGSHRTLRVAVIGQTLLAYWRVQDAPMDFGTSVAKGARIDADSDPDLRQKAMALTRGFCRQTRINLAGFDLIFDESKNTKKAPQPLFLEINYFFGRTGLGGSEHFYAMLEAEINKWLVGLGLAVNRPSPEQAAGETS
ncbi:MAG: glutathione synthase [Desulfosarcina sp.]|nr:glutathione synthase [Desulfosarcina sp.]MBC2742529.1 glutathione synthase [Desulfosarcina sp.]MBC2765439.1 glutathione synthase [Desulfosarcina sp.]